MTDKKRAWRITGLWSKSLPNGGTLLKAKVPLAALTEAVQGALAAGLSSVEVEVWEAREQGEGKPTHSLRVVEPFQASGTVQAGPTWARQNDSPPAVAGDSYPF